MNDTMPSPAMPKRSYHGYKKSPSSFLGVQRVVRDGVEVVEPSEAFSAEKAKKTKVGPVRIDRGGKRVILAAALVLPVLDQGALGTCETHAWTSGLAMCMETPQQLSRFDLYLKCRYHDGSFPKDDGTMGETCALVIAEAGICLEKDHPYDPSPANDNARLNLVPSEEALQSGYDHRIDAAHRITSFGKDRGADVRASIDAGRPVQIGGTVSQAYEDYFNDLQPSDPTGGKDGLIAFGTMTHSVGGHAQLIVGYWEVSPGVFIYLVRNSWGTSGGVAEFPGHAYYTGEGLDWCDELFSIFVAPKFKAA